MPWCTSQAASPDDLLHCAQCRPARRVAHQLLPWCLLVSHCGLLLLLLRFHQPSHLPCAAKGCQMLPQLLVAAAHHSMQLLAAKHARSTQHRSELLPEGLHTHSGTCASTQRHLSYQATEGLTKQAYMSALCGISGCHSWRVELHRSRLMLTSGPLHPQLQGKSCM